MSGAFLELSAAPKGRGLQDLSRARGYVQFRDKGIMLRTEYKFWY
jgi:hypothetical protein